MTASSRGPHRRRSVPLVALVLAVASLGFARGEAPPTIDEAARRGRVIYEEGTSPSGGEIVALIGQARIPVAGSAMRCARCHGEDGTGRREGGVSPSNLTWPVLTRRLEPGVPGGRSRPAYDEAALRRAITMGLDPAGRPLNPAMPRFQMSHRDMADLVAWLRHLGHVDAVGVERGRLVIGTLLPPAGTRMASGLAELQQRLADRANEDGGVYGRRIDLRIRHGADGRDGMLEAFDELLAVERPLAVVAPFPGPDPAGFVDLARRHGVPVIGPLTLEPPPLDVEDGVAPPVFHLLPGRADRARALARFAIDSDAAGSGRTGLLAPRMTVPLQEEVLAALRETFDGTGRLVADEAFDFGAQDAAALVSRLRGRGVERLFVLADEMELSRLLAEIVRARWEVELFLPSMSAARGIVDAAQRTGWNGVVHVALPAAPGTESVLARQVAAAWAVLVEVLRRAGAGVSRELVVAELESLYELRLKDLPPITFEANRRVGSRGAWIVTLDAGTGTPRGAPRWRGL